MKALPKGSSTDGTYNESIMRRSRKISRGEVDGGEADQAAEERRENDYVRRTQRGNEVGAFFRPRSGRHLVSMPLPCMCRSTPWVFSYTQNKIGSLLQSLRVGALGFLDIRRVGTTHLLRDLCYHAHKCPSCNNDQLN